jgi:hypothetical protein
VIRAAAHSALPLPNPVIERIMPTKVEPLHD